MLLSLVPISPKFYSTETDLGVDIKSAYWEIHL